MPITHSVSLAIENPKNCVTHENMSFEIHKYHTKNLFSRFHLKLILNEITIAIFSSKYLLKTHAKHKIDFQFHSSIRDRTLT